MVGLACARAWPLSLQLSSEANDRAAMLAQAALLVKSTNSFQVQIDLRQLGLSMYGEE